MQARRHPRKKVRHGGAILFTRECFHGPAQIRLPCDLVDISETGARLSGAILHALPPVFVLEVKSINLNEQVQLRWKLKHEIGVMFLQPINLEQMNITVARSPGEEGGLKRRRRA
ncbi:MAG: hypothetical protein K2P80_15205 [Beijerinckiaceae bacterium]|nr:hypothetical protein [Beijerinckiaceae bacterium]